MADARPTVLAGRWPSILLMVCLLYSCIHADGMFMAFDPTEMRHELQREDEQVCFVNHRHGVEHMLLSVGLSDVRTDKAVWIVPVPAPAESISLDIIKGLPKMRGNGIVADAGIVWRRSLFLMSLSQLYPFLFWYRSLEEERPNLMGSDYGAYDGHGDHGVTISDHVERLGLTAELVSTRERGALYRYLKEKGVDLPAGTAPVLDQYDSVGYSFIVSWISDSGKFMHESIPTGRAQDVARAIGIAATFPARRPYFPMRLSSVYGDRVLPIYVYVVGLVKPELWAGIRNWCEVDYYRTRDFKVPKELRFFFNGESRVHNLRYTRLSCLAPAREFTKDLWFKPGAPALVILADSVVETSPIAGIIAFVLCSCLASMFAGMIAFKGFGRRATRYFVFGLWNCLSLLGFTLAAFLITVRQPGPVNPLDTASGKRVAGNGRKVGFVLLFAVLFDMMVLLAHLVLAVPLSCP